MDDLIRTFAFNWLEELVNIYGDVLERSILEKGFEYKGKRITLIGPQGIWKPQIMQYPLSITTTSNSPYDDSFTKDGFLKYRYRGSDPNHRDNVGLRELMRLQKPLIYFHGVVKGKYLVNWPVYIIHDNLADLTFTAQIDEIKNKNEISEVADPAELYRRSYLTANIRTRLHQRSFRERVLIAYHTQCALCRLKHAELLDAAYIIEDKAELGDPIVQNGLTLCKIHHAAFDKNIIGINEDYIIKVREDILIETDGPMLKFGIQSLENNKIVLPNKKSDWPDQERLKQRFDLFLKTG